ncbi:P-glycoprotein-9 [Aphelenchoides bicaudatus]|nr:P-glycoprotein-9 [Aphelenchoides bicaudatus]
MSETAVGNKSKVPLLQKFKKAADKDEKPKLQKVSIFKLWSYANRSDLILLFIGITVSILTGFGLPYLAIIIGSLSNAFVNATLATEYYYLPINTTNGWRFIGDIYTLDSFRDNAMEKVWRSVYIGVILFCSATIQIICFLTVCENMLNRIRKAFFKAVYDKNQTGSLASKMFDDLERIQEGTGDKVALAVQYTAQFFGGFIVAFTYDWKLTLIMMSLSPLLIICGAFIAQLMAKSAVIEAEKYAVAGGIAEESISSIRTVYAFNGQQIEINRYSEALEKAKSTGIWRSLWIGCGLASTFLVLFGSYCLAFWVGTNFVVDNGMAPEIMITVFFSVMMGSMALGQSSPQYAVIGTAQGCAASIFDIIDRKPEIDSYSTEGSTPQIDGHIVMKNVNFTYATRPEVTVLNNLSLEIKPGQTVALVGSSGSGKSTICSLLLRYYNIASGSITIDGQEIDSINIKYWRRNTGVVSQEPILFNCSIRDNIQFGIDAEISEEDLRAACRKANASDFIERLPRAQHYLEATKRLWAKEESSYLEGQKQRIAIARALVSRPRLLILDEATSALDAESEALVQDALNKAAKDTTTLIVAHRLSTVKNADCIFAMQDGSVVEAGKHDELMQKQGFYYNLVNSQVFADHVEEEVEELGQRRRTRASNSVGSVTSAGAPRKLLSRNSVADSTVDTARQQKDEVSEKKRLEQDLKDEGATPKNLLHILQYAKKEWFLLLGGVISCVIGGNMFAEPDPEIKRQKGHNWALMFLVLGGIQAVCMLVQSVCFGSGAERLTKRLRLALFKKIFSMHIGFFDEPTHSTGKLCTRLATDCPNVKSAIDYRLGSVFSCVVSLVFGIGLAFYYNWIMAILVITIFPLSGVGHFVHIKFFRARNTNDTKELEKSGSLAIEAMQNIRTVQALTLESNFYRKFCEYLQKPFETRRYRAVFQALSYGFASSVFYFLHAAAFGFGVYLIMNHNVKPMSVLRTLFAISFTAGSLGYASAYFPEYAKARFAAGIIFKMLGYKPEIDNLSKGGKRLKEFEGRISFKNVNFTYPARKEVQVLHDFDLQIEAGKSLAIVGASGSGKSTIISLLERFYDSSLGSITIDDENIPELSLQQLRSEMSLVPQEATLFDRTIKENIVYGLENYTEEDVLEAIRLANIETTIMDLPDGLATRVGDKGVQLSGGQKQRCAIARALIRKPKILLLDEATSALDAESESLVQKALDKACSGRTSIIVAHRLSTIVNADKIAVMKNGKILELGTHQDLYAKQGAYFELVEKQNIKK